MQFRGNSIVFNDKSGFDQSTQLISLIQILLSPTTRTIQGFCNLIEREWISFGFPFASMCGHYYTSSYELSTSNSVQNVFNINGPSTVLKKDPSTITPLFIQFLDAVWQLLQNFPHHFDFNEEFLVTLALAPYEGLFGNFLCDSEQERKQFFVTPHDFHGSFWTYIFSNLTRYQNPFYRHDDSTLFPDLDLTNMQVWSAFYRKWDRSAPHKVQSNIANTHYILLNENFELRSNK